MYQNQFGGPQGDQIDGMFPADAMFSADGGSPIPTKTFDAGGGTVDLERHYALVHDSMDVTPRVPNGDVHYTPCDYPKCGSKSLTRKDHYRDHSAASGKQVDDVHPDDNDYDDTVDEAEIIDPDAERFGLDRVPRVRRIIADRAVLSYGRPGPRRPQSRYEPRLIDPRYVDELDDLRYRDAEEYIERR